MTISRKASVTMKQTIAVVAAIIAIQASPLECTELKSVTSDRLMVARNSRFRPLLTKLQDRGELVFASFPAYPRPRIKLELERSVVAACELDFPAMDEMSAEDARPLSFDSLANGKLVLSALYGRRYLLSLVVDVDKCDVLATVSTSLVDDDVADNIVVLAGEDVFDVFLTRHRHCEAAGKACRLRYSDRGILIGVSEFVVPEDAEGWSVASVTDKNFTDGYFYSVARKDATIVQRMEQDLKVQQELRISGKPFLYSSAHGSVNSCRGISPTDLECSLRDRELNERSRVLVEAEYLKSFVRAARLFNLSDGSAAILYVLQVFVEPSIANQFDTYLQRVDLHGRAGNPVKYQEDVCKDFKDLGMIALSDNFYCFSVYCADGVHTKCAALAQM